LTHTPYRRLRNPLREGQSGAAATIRRATLSELDAVVSIWSEGQISQGHGQMNLDEAKRIFSLRITSENKKYGIWVAQLNGRVVGRQSLHRARANPVLNWAESSTYISPEHKRVGVGRKLLTFATGYARVVKLTYIQGFIQRDNPAPIQIVESLGWRRVGVLPRLSDSDTEWLFYVYAVPQ
jgi:L-amino acid N-acyltransferase YncA